MFVHNVLFGLLLLLVDNNIVNSLENYPLKCFLQNNEGFSPYSALDPSKPAIKIGFFSDWDYSLVVSQLAKQLIEEILNVKVDLVAVPYDGESYVKMVNDGTIDAHVTTYSGELDIQLSNLRNLGSCGFQEHIGWHIPEYMIDVAPELVYYKDAHSYERSDIGQLLRSSINCTDDTRALQCVNELKSQENDRKCKLTFISDPDLFEFGMDSSIIGNLGLNHSIDAQYLDDVEGVDTIKLNMFLAKYSQNASFMINAMSPSPLLATAEKEQKPLIRVNLPKFTTECNEHFFNDDSYQQFNCDYIPESIIKIVNADVESRFPDVYRMLSHFTLYQESYLNEILYSISKGQGNEEAICNFIKDNNAFVSQIVTQRDVLIEKSISAVAQTIMIVLSSLMLLYTMAQSFFLFFYYHDPNVKGGSVMFLMFMILGGCLYFSWLIVLSLDPSATTCALAPWLKHLGFFLVYFAIIVKTSRVALLFNSKMVTNSRNLVPNLVPNLRDDRLLIYYFIFMIAIVVYLIVWTLLSQPIPQRQIVSTVTVDDHLETTYENVCVTNESFELIGFILQFIVLLIACFLAILVRKLPSNFNESLLIGISVYNAFFCVIISCVIYFATIDTEIEYILTCIFSILSMALVIMLIISSKILYAHLGWVQKHNSDSSNYTPRGFAGTANYKPTALSRNRPGQSQKSGRGASQMSHKEAVKSILSMIDNEDQGIIELDDGGVFDGDEVEVHAIVAEERKIVPILKSDTV